MKRATALLFVLLTGVVHAQDPATGFPPYGSFEGGRFDSVNRQNLNVNFSTPIVVSRGRGLSLSHAVVHDSLNWKRVGSTWSPVVNGSGVFRWGWKTSDVTGKLTWE
ncbi:MAG: hypothetical protein ACRD5W_04130, partial [Candidatus Acidiferrales bacterium]